MNDQIIKVRLLYMKKMTKDPKKYVEHMKKKMTFCKMTNMACDT